jgi:hypothetical protein
VRRGDLRFYFIAMQEQPRCFVSLLPNICLYQTSRCCGILEQKVIYLTYVSFEVQRQVSFSLLLDKNGYILLLRDSLGGCLRDSLGNTGAPMSMCRIYRCRWHASGWIPEFPFFLTCTCCPWAAYCFRYCSGKSLDLWFILF